MSLILDALRKMEQDRNSRRGAAQNIRPEVLRYRGAPAKPRQAMTRWYLAALLGAVLLLCGIGAGFLLKGNHAATVAQEFPEAGSLTPAPPVTPVTPGKAVTPIAPGQPAVPAVPAAPAVAAPVAARETEAPVVSAPAEPERAHPARQPAPVAPRARPKSDREAPPKPVRREAAVVVQEAPAGIAISGIAWQDEHSLRRAVINGALVGEGAEVAGARVVEIREDRVWLSRDGKVFAAVLSSH